MVESTALEMRHRCKPIGGSNPSLSASLSQLFLFVCGVLSEGVFTHLNAYTRAISGHFHSQARGIFATQRDTRCMKACIA